MEQIRFSGRVALAALLVAGVAAGDVRRAQAAQHALRATGVERAAAAAAPRKQQAADRSVNDTADARKSGKAGSQVHNAVSMQADVSGGKDESGGQALSPVSLQVPQEEIDKLSARLSEGCSRRFAAALAGEGPLLHSFGKAVEASEESCRRLNGSICDTHALIAHEVHSQAQDGRKMRQTTEVSGEGCLPRECLGGADLREMSDLMRRKARETVPGTGVEVGLRVDCSRSGGGAADSGAATHFGEGQAASGELNKSGEHSQPTGPQHSAASSGSSVVAVLVAMAAAALWRPGSP